MNFIYTWLAYIVAKIGFLNSFGSSKNPTGFGKNGNLLRNQKHRQNRIVCKMSDVKENEALVSKDVSKDAGDKLGGTDAKGERSSAFASGVCTTYMSAQKAYACHV